METVAYIGLAQAARLAPTRPSPNAVWRWCRRGLVARSGERIKLRHVRVGGKLFTTAANLDQFFQQLADADAVHFDDTPLQVPTVKASRTASRRAADIERAERELKNAGV